ncbi:c-type cytochrome biogenesis protein CcmI/CycH [Dokdonella sp.]|uniref:tetratricopeptide repeat protein n=1 Tax=Dokdonella sp. TaxID=2291710 RepID=UPI002F4172AC
MLIFMVCAASMVAAALAFVLVPLLRHRGTTGDGGLVARQRRALDEALAAGVIDADEHARKRAALASTSAASVAPSRTAFAALLLVALLLPASALLLYRLVGAPQALDPANLVAADGEHGPDMAQAIAALAARLKEQPDDVEGWALLARAYQATGRAGESLDAYRRAHALAKDNAALTVEYAQALAVAAPDHRIDGEARALLDGVLAADPSNQRALWLVGISDFQDGKFDAAIARWNTLLPLLGPGEVADSVREQIALAQARRDGKEPPAAATTPSRESGAASTAASTPSAPTAASANTPRLTVQVALDPKLKDRLDPAATLFVFARAASGPPMPLAIQRLKASQLPLTVTLDESTGMLPNLKLSMFPQVVIGARVSTSGNAMPQSGDLQVLSPPTDVHRTDPIALVIDQIVP